MRPLILIILDGLGINSDTRGNAFTAAKTPIIDDLVSTYPTTQIEASGSAVGLPDGQMGNSEVGHLNIGAGRVVYQDLTRINKAVSSGEFKKNTPLNNLFRNINQSDSSLHLFGLISDGGVHSHIDHLFALIDFAEQAGIKNLYIHAVMDGRDTPPMSGLGYIIKLENYLSEKKVGIIVSVMGRFYAMDRDNRWERVKEAYSTMVERSNITASSAAAAIERSYVEGKGDEFILPTSIQKEGDESVLIKDGDSIIFFNFRADRAREITRAFMERDFTGFKDVKRVTLSSFLCMTEYDATFNLPVIFPPIFIDETIGSIISKAGMSQLRIAETEKYAHVTFFLNGGEEAEYDGEKRILISSPKDVTTYDEKPAMSAPEVTDQVVEILGRRTFDFIVLNYANSDMVGHTGVLDAAVKAIETVDSCLGRLITSAKTGNYRILITADHGNAEEMINIKSGQPHTAHTTNAVHFILVDDDLKGRKLRAGGKLADISPTILNLFDMDIPKKMDGTSLLLPQ